MMSFFKRKKSKSKDSVETQAMDDVTQTLLCPCENDSEKTLCFDSYETDTTEISSYMSIGTRKNQQDSVCFDHNEFGTACVVCDGMGGLSGGERASSLAAQGMTQHLLENAQVVGTPGSGFGPSGETYFRLTAFGSYENTVEAVDRLKKLSF